MGNKREGWGWGKGQWMEELGGVGQMKESAS